MSARQNWTRREVDAGEWAAIAGQLAASGHWTLAGLWGERDAVHMALGDGASIEIVSLACPDGEFPSVARHHAPAHRLERAITDLFGLTPTGAADERPWLDHGRWPVRHPLGRHPLGASPHDGSGDAYPFLTAEGEGLHQIPVGPVHAGIIEPGHFRFHASGETVVRLEQRLGYTHKGLEGLMQGRGVADAARLAARLSGDSTVASSIAFARAAEEALGIAIPARAHWLRALMAELERLANHLGDIGAICNDASFAILHAHTGVLRERVLRQAQAAFGHRLMMERVVPGGVTADPDTAALQGIRDLIGLIRTALPPLIELYDDTASLQDRTVGTGILSHDLASRYGCGGYIGRASGRDFDARRNLPYAPYDALDFTVPVLREGDVNARVWVRIREVEQSLALVERITKQLPSGPVAVAAEAGENAPGEGLALIEGFRGDILCWLRLGEGGAIERCHLRDPSWFQWPLLEAAIYGNIVADFPLCNKSFNCSYSGHDL